MRSRDLTSRCLAHPLRSLWQSLMTEELEVDPSLPSPRSPPQPPTKKVTPVPRPPTPPRRSHAPSAQSLFDKRPPRSPLPAPTPQKTRPPHGSRRVTGEYYSRTTRRTTRWRSWCSIHPWLLARERNEDLQRPRRAHRGPLGTLGKGARRRHRAPRRARRHVGVHLTRSCVFRMV
jgi:hypothetical protein